MSKRKFIPIALTVFTFSVFAVYKFGISQNSSDEPDTNISPPEIIQPVQAAETSKSEPKAKPKKQGYEVKEYKGNIAVFEIGEKKPFRVTDIEVKNLPEADQKELKIGIEAPDNDKLQTLLEDYLS